MKGFDFFRINPSHWGFKPQSQDEIDLYFFPHPEYPGYFYVAYKLSPEYLETQGFRGWLLSHKNNRWIIPKINFDFDAWALAPYINPCLFQFPLVAKDYQECIQFYEKFTHYQDLLDYRSRKVDNSNETYDRLFQKAFSIWRNYYSGYKYIRK